METLGLSGFKADLFYLLLLYCGKYEHLPDLFDVMGKEQTYRLMDIFAGSTIKFPSIDELKRYAKEIDIYLRLNSANPKLRPKVIRDIADEVLLEEARVRQIYGRVRKIIESELGFEVTGTGYKRGLRIVTQ